MLMQKKRSKKDLKEKYTFKLRKKAYESEPERFEGDESDDYYRPMQKQSTSKPPRPQRREGSNSSSRGYIAEIR